MSASKANIGRRSRCVGLARVYDLMGSVTCSRLSFTVVIPWGFPRHRFLAIVAVSPPRINGWKNDVRDLEEHLHAKGRTCPDSSRQGV